MIKKILEHPYLWTSVVFLLALAFGWRFLYWRQEDFAFLLLLYFIVTLGIRLDDISKKIGPNPDPVQPQPGEVESISRKLDDIRSGLVQLNTTLGRLAAALEDRRASAGNGDKLPDKQ